MRRFGDPIVLVTFLLVTLFVSKTLASRRSRRKSPPLHAHKVLRWDESNNGYIGEIDSLRRSLQDEESDVPLNGDPLCPCVPTNSLDPITYEDLTPAYQEDFGEDINYTTFGYGCKAHDNGTTATCRACTDSSLCPWCELSWCYVDPNNCTLQHTRSIGYPSYVSIRFYSYATCGSLDSFTGTARLRSLEGQTFRVGINHHPGGFTGAYHKNGSQYIGPLEDWSGVIVDFFRVASQIGKFNMTLTTPPTFLQNRSVAGVYANPFDECIYATTLGYLDFCIGTYAATTARIAATDFALISSSNFKLLRTGDSASDTWVANAGTIYQPFQEETWIFMILFVIPVMGLLFIVHEWNQRGSLYRKTTYVVISHKDSAVDEIQGRTTPWYRHMMRSIYMAFLSVLQARYNNPLVTQGARIHLIGFSFFILTLLAVYTANLAAILQFQLFIPQVVSIESAVVQGYKICALREIAYIAMQNKPQLHPTTFIFDPVDGKPGFYTVPDRRSRALAYLDENLAEDETNMKVPHPLRKYCHAALAFEEDLQIEQTAGRNCDKVFVGETVGTLDVGIPLFESVSKAMSSLIWKLKNDGYVFKLIANHTPVNTCSQKATVNMADFGAGGKSLNISDLSGIWLVSFGFALFGLLMTLSNHMKKRREKTAVRSLYRVDQHGQRLNRLERDDGWIHEEGVKVFIGHRGHLKWTTNGGLSSNRTLGSTHEERRVKQKLLTEKMQADYQIPPEAFRSFPVTNDFQDDSTSFTVSSSSGTESIPKHRKKKRISLGLTS
jgi:hypothetical protein